MSDLKWPEGAEVKIDGDYTKWVDGVEYSSRGGGRWVESSNSWSLDEYKSDGDFKIIERPIETECEGFIEQAAKVLQENHQDVTGLCNKSVEMFHSAAKALLVSGFKAPKQSLETTLNVDALIAMNKELVEALESELENDYIHPQGKKSIRETLAKAKELSHEG